MISLSILASYLCLFYPRQEPKVRFFGVAAFTWLVFVLGGIVSIGRFYHHYFIQLVAPLALVSAYWVAILPTRIRVIPVLASLVLLYADPIVYPRVTNFFAKEEFNPKNIDMVAAFVRENTRPGEPIFLYQNGALCLYFLTERFPPTKVFMDAQMLAENKDGPTLLEDGLKRWKKNPPKFIVTGNSSWYSIPEIDELLSRDYSKHTNFSVFQIHKRNGSDDLETQRPSDSGQAVKTLPSGSLTQSLGGAL